MVTSQRKPTPINYGGCDIRILRFSTLEEAQERLQLLKKAFEDECEDSEFLDCISIEDDTPDHYEATDGEDRIEISVLTRP